MDILILSHADSCRSRIAQSFLSSFGKGMKIYSAGIQPSAEIHPLTLRVIKEAGIETSNQPPHSIYEYTDKPWDCVIALCENTHELQQLFSKGAGNWYNCPFDDLLSKLFEDESKLWESMNFLKESIRKSMYELYRDELMEQLLPRCTCGANTFCRCE